MRMRMGCSPEDTDACQHHGADSSGLQHLKTPSLQKSKKHLRLHSRKDADDVNGGRARTLHSEHQLHRDPPQHPESHDFAMQSDRKRKFIFLKGMAWISCHADIRCQCGP
jgi:hypothetical protein